MTTIPMLTIKFRGKKQLIPYDFIQYIESISRKLIVHTENHDYIYYNTLDNLYADISKEQFIRIHKSYVISKNYVSHYTNKNVTLLSGTILPISSTYKDEALQKLDTCITTQTEQKVSTNVTGSIQCIRGKYKSSIIRIYANVPVLIGRDEHCDICYNLPFVSRSHCSVIFHADANTYELTDFSFNGTFVLETPPDTGKYSQKMFKKLKPDTPFNLRPGTIIHFGDIDNIFQLV